ncbi:hypothetical protein D030_2446A, partial [Vibrio parahaemolyticus AQ3810]
MGLLDDQ